MRRNPGRWQDEQGSQALQAAGAALAAAVIVLALLAGARTMAGPAVEPAFQSAASVLSGGGADCGGTPTVLSDQPTQPGQQQQQQPEDRPWWNTALDITQGVLDMVGQGRQIQPI